MENNHVIFHTKSMNDHKRYSEKLKQILSKEELLIFKKDTYSLVDFGYEYVDIGEYRKAFQLFNIGMRINGYDPDILNGLGISLCELGRLKSSLLILQKAASLYPDDAITLANLAGVYWETCEFEKSVYYYQKSIDLDPTIDESHFNLINLYYDMGSLHMAYICCLNFLKHRPDNPSAISLRDEILLNLGISIC